MSTNIVLLIQNNEVIGHSTDTVFGLIAKVEKENIKLLNKIKERELDKPVQILFNTIEDVLEVIEPNDFVIETIKKYDPSKTSFIVKVKKEFADKYLLDSYKQTINFRIPLGEIQEVLKETKMLFATSANKNDKPPIKHIEEFKKEFPEIKVFGNEQETRNKDSKIISLINNKEEIIRE